LACDSGDGACGDYDGSSLICIKSLSWACLLVVRELASIGSQVYQSSGS
jgi:hypothetical protein